MRGTVVVNSEETEESEQKEEGEKGKKTNKKTSYDVKGERKE